MPVGSNVRSTDIRPQRKDCLGSNGYDQTPIVPPKRSACFRRIKVDHGYSVTSRNPVLRSEIPAHQKPRLRNASALPLPSRPVVPASQSSYKRLTLYRLQRLLHRYPPMRPLARLRRQLSTQAGKACFCHGKHRCPSRPTCASDFADRASYRADAPARSVRSPP